MISDKIACVYALINTKFLQINEVDVETQATL